jgi:hypothetical protein
MHSARGGGRSATAGFNDAASVDNVNTLNPGEASQAGESTLDSPFTDPEMEAVRQKLNEMILAARR